MLFLPGILFSLLTFPGIVIHELAHKIFCDLLDVPIRSVRYFRLGNPAGYVIHEIPPKLSQRFWISVGPFIINSFTAVVLSYLASKQVTESHSWYLLIWVATSAGIHAFPSDTDMKSVFSKGSIMNIFALPFVILVWIANKLKYLWFDFFYAILLVYVGLHLKFPA